MALSPSAQSSARCTRPSQAHLMPLSVGTSATEYGTMLGLFL
ncbi:hypothetical protein AZE42_03436 [Rhizopogon vesiculosus]|uniref:Uncharacterized protein n=1 Tax=Rhizopogon vesiculosus TaxID=180088 RepID=A0A1J8QFG5_9AGAM|nr:hypothetical protein AZE42_03436 [Rhizopogon vesiculosus]